MSFDCNYDSIALNIKSSHQYQWRVAAAYHVRMTGSPRQGGVDGVMRGTPRHPPLKPHFVQAFVLIIKLRAGLSRLLWSIQWEAGTCSCDRPSCCGMRQRSPALCLSEVRLLPLGSRHRRLELLCLFYRYPEAFSSPPFPHLSSHHPSSTFQSITKNHQFVSKDRYKYRQDGQSRYVRLPRASTPRSLHCFLPAGTGGRGHSSAALRWFERVLRNLDGTKCDRSAALSFSSASPTPFEVDARHLSFKPHGSLDSIQRPVPLNPGILLRSLLDELSLTMLCNVQSASSVVIPRSPAP